MPGPTLKGAGKLGSSKVPAGCPLHLGALLRDAVGRSDDPGERRQTAANPLEIDHHEQLLVAAQ